MASIDEVWGKDFGKQTPKPLSSKGNVPEKRDPVKEGRVAASPQERSAEAVQRNRKTIDDLSKSLPIAETDEDVNKNYHGAKFAPMASSAEPIRESFGPQYAWPQDAVLVGPETEREREREREGEGKKESEER